MEILTMELIRYTAYAAWNPILIAIGLLVAIMSLMFLMASIEIGDTALVIVSSIICFILGLSTLIALLKILPEEEQKNWLFKIDCDEDRELIKKGITELNI